MNTLTVLPFLLVFFVAVTGMPTRVVKVDAWGCGHEYEQPWKTRSMGALRSLGSSLTAWFGRVWKARVVRLALAGGLALLAADISSAHATGVMLAGIVAEPTLAEVKTAIEASNRLFEEFKAANDTRLKQIEKNGVADPLLEQKLDKLNKAMEDQSKINEAFIAVQAKVNKFGLSGGDEKSRETAERELRQFNIDAKAHALANGRPTPVEMSADDYKTYKSAFDKYLRRGERSLDDAERKALSVGTDPQGGYLVTPDLSGRMVQRAFETSPMRQYASVQAISTDALEGTVDTDEATVGWVAELGSRTTSATPLVPQPWRIPVHEIYSQPPASQKLLEDANIDVTAWLAKKTGDKIGRTANAAFVTGNGVGKPRGFASYTTAATADATRAWGVFEHIATGSNGSFGSDPTGITKLLDLIHAMKDVHAARAGFYMNRTTLGGLRKVTDASAAGKFIFIPSFQAGQPDQVMGYPVRRLQDMATYTTTDALAIAFGDMEETYQIVDRLGITVLVDPYTNKPYVNFYTRARVGGDALNFDAMKFLKFGTS